MHLVRDVHRCIAAVLPRLSKATKLSSANGLIFLFLQNGCIYAFCVTFYSSMFVFVVVIVFVVFIIIIIIRPDVFILHRSETRGWHKQC